MHLTLGLSRAIDELILLLVNWSRGSGPWGTDTFANAAGDNDVPSDLPPDLPPRDEARPRRIHELVPFGRPPAVVSCASAIESS